MSNSSNFSNVQRLIYAYIIIHQLLNNSSTFYLRMFVFILSNFLDITIELHD